MSSKYEPEFKLFCQLFILLEQGRLCLDELDAQYHKGIL